MVGKSDLDQRHLEKVFCPHTPSCKGTESVGKISPLKNSVELQEAAGLHIALASKAQQFQHIATPKHIDKTQTQNEYQANYTKDHQGMPKTGAENNSFTV